MSEAALNTPNAELRLAWQLLPTDPDTAVALAELGVAQQPERGDGWLVLGLLLARSGNGKDAAQALARAIEREPTSVDAHMALADVLVELLDYKGAARELRCCFDLDPLMRTPAGVRARAMAMRLKKDLTKRLQS